MNREDDTAKAAAQFVVAALYASWEGSGFDGADIQDLAVKLGLIRETTYDPAKHGPNSVGAEAGDSWFVMTPALRALAAPISQPGAAP